MEGTILLRGVLALRSCWHAWARGPTPTVVRTPTALEDAGRVVTPGTHSFLSPYRNHLGLPVQPAGGFLCLHCGAIARDNRRGFINEDCKCPGAFLALTNAACSAVLMWPQGGDMPGGHTSPDLRNKWENLYLRCLVRNGGPLDPPPDLAGSPAGADVGELTAATTEVDMVARVARGAARLAKPRRKEGASPFSHDRQRAAFPLLGAPPVGGPVPPRGGVTGAPAPPVAHLGAAWLVSLGENARLQAERRAARSRSPWGRHRAALQVTADGGCHGGWPSPSLGLRALGVGTVFRQGWRARAPALPPEFV